MRIWRVEHRYDEVGPYTLGQASRCYLNTGCDLQGPDVERPLPSTDPLLRHVWDTNRHGGGSWRYGFGTIQQARAWFGLPPAIGYLTKEGFCLKRVEVPDDFVLVGAKQVCYDSNVAVGLYKRPLHYLLKGFVC